MLEQPNACPSTWLETKFSCPESSLFQRLIRWSALLACLGREGDVHGMKESWVPVSTLSKSDGTPVQSDCRLLVHWAMAFMLHTLCMKSNNKHLISNSWTQHTVGPEDDSIVRVYHSHRHTVGPEADSLPHQGLSQV